LPGGFTPLPQDANFAASITAASDNPCTVLAIPFRIASMMRA